MIARLLATIAFWLLMAVLIPGAAVVVVCLYFPFVALKGAFLTLTGKLDKARGGAPTTGNGGSSGPGRASA